MTRNEADIVRNLTRWREERTGEAQDDKLRQGKEKESDVVTTPSADDTQSRAVAKTKTELERRNSRWITEVCRQLKAMQLTVNEEKATYMILATKSKGETTGKSG